MKIDIKGILQGINNSIFVKEEVEKIAEDRANICKGCPYYSKNVEEANKLRKDAYCVVCGCNIHLKTRALSAHCPLGDPGYPEEITKQTRKWDSVTNDSTSEKLMSTPELEKSLNEYKIKLSQNKVEE